MSPIDSTASQDPGEGAIRFAYGLTAPDGPVTDIDTLHALRGWRAVLRRLGLVGQTAGRYGGLGFGNLSARDREHPEQLVITASQSSGTETLDDDDLVRITHCNPARFWVDARGHRPPSSETLTHAMCYRADPDVHWVFHGHSPDIWPNAGTLAVPATGAHLSSGSPALAAAVAELLAREHARPLTFVTLGHEDGVFACGARADDTGAALASLLSRTLGRTIAPPP